jgi:hypothetical protein
VSDEPSTAGTVQKAKLCKVCGEPIALIAKKCTHCDSYQNWFSNISISSSVLTMLVALLSVLTVTVPVFREALTPKNSDIIATLQDSDETRIMVVVSNKGVRPGTLRSTAFLIMEPKPVNEDPLPQERPLNPAETYIRLRFEEKSVGAYIVEPGKSALIKYIDYDASPQRVPGSLPRYHCRVRVVFVSFEGHTENIDLPELCDYFEDFIDAYNKHRQ